MKLPEELFQVCILVGTIINPDVNNGQPVPLFTPREHTEGKPSINTLEGWNAYAQELERRRAAKTPPRCGVMP